MKKSEKTSSVLGVNSMLEIELKEQGKISRLTNKTFQFDKRLGEGFFSANYFLKSNKIVKEQEPNHIVTMQWFQRRDDSLTMRERGMMECDV